jgi:hypothetical protein
MPSMHVTGALSAYVDGALNEGERAHVERHLETCEDCRHHLSALRDLVTTVRSVEPVAAPEGFRAQVRARVEQIGARPAATTRWWPSLPMPWRVLSAAAAVLVIGIFAVNLLRTEGPVAMREFRGPGDSPAVTGDRMRSAAPSAPEGAQRAMPGQNTLALRRVIRTAQVEVEVDKVEDAAERLLRIAEEAGGFFADSSYAETNGVPHASFVLRVPVPRFAGVVASLDGVGRVARRSIHGQDVTEEFVDLEARVRNLERHEQRLLAFMDRTTKVSELLAIEQELTRVRGEVESLTGRARYLSDQSDLATLSVAVRQKTKKTSGALWDFGATLQRMQAAFVATVRQLLTAVENVGIAISALLPVLTLGALAWMAVRRWRLRRAW